MRWLKKARAKQLPPEGDDWDIWSVITGRGFGKTRSLCEFAFDRGTFREEAQSEEDAFRIAVLAPTFADLRKITFEGASGLLGIIGRDESVFWKGSKKAGYNRNNQELRLWNGAIISGFSAEEPDRLRGSQFHMAIVEELASFKYSEAMDQLALCLRLGDHPRMAIATTPRPIKLIKDLIAKAEKEPNKCVVVRGSTFENTALSKRYFELIAERYEGTRLGRQELYADVLGDTPGALWTQDMIELARLRAYTDPVTGEVRLPKLPDFTRVVVAIDPMSGEPDAEEREGIGSENGIIVAARGNDGHAYILEDLSKSALPAEWGMIAVDAYHRHKADIIVGEVNQGGAMVHHTIATVPADEKTGSPAGASVNYRAVHASRGKVTRAEPISALYSRGIVHHVGMFSSLESQMTTYVPGNKSPDRMDALVWALTDLMVDQTEVPTTAIDIIEPSAFDFGQNIDQGGYVPWDE